MTKRIAKEKYPLVSIEKSEASEDLQTAGNEDTNDLNLAAIDLRGVL